MRNAEGPLVAHCPFQIKCEFKHAATLYSDYMPGLGADTLALDPLEYGEAVEEGFSPPTNGCVMSGWG